jgi:hypothetical protein
MEQVTVANFSSILEIAFAANFLFVFFELRPLWGNKFFELEKRFAKTYYSIWHHLGGLKDNRWVHRHMKLSGPIVIYIGLELIAVVESCLIALRTLSLLISAGFDPTYKIARSEMVLYLWLMFLVPIAFYLLSYWLYNFALRRHIEAAIEYKTGEDLNS